MAEPYSEERSGTTFFGLTRQKTYRLQYVDGYVMDVTLEDKVIDIMDIGTHAERRNLMHYIRETYGPLIDSGEKIVSNEHAQGLENTQKKDVSGCSESEPVSRCATSEPAKAVWDPASVQAFMNLCVEKKHELDDRFVRNKRVFQDMRKELEAQGYAYTDHQIEIKYLNLLRCYKRDLEKSKRKSGASFTRTAEFNKLEDIFGHRHDLNPEQVAGSSIPPKKTKLQTSQEGNSSSCDKETVKKRKCISPSSAAVAALNDTLQYLKEADAAAEERRKASQQLDERKILALEKLVEAMSKK